MLSSKCSNSNNNSKTANQEHSPWKSCPLEIKKKISPDKQLKEFTTTRTALEEWLKGVLVNGNKKTQISDMKIYNT